VLHHAVPSTTGIPSAVGAQTVGVSCSFSCLVVCTLKMFSDFTPAGLKPNIHKNQQHASLTVGIFYGVSQRCRQTNAKGE
jgi:hypothetical protein